MFTLSSRFFFVVVLKKLSAEQSYVLAGQDFRRTTIVASNVSAGNRPCGWLVVKILYRALEIVLSNRLSELRCFAQARCWLIIINVLVCPQAKLYLSKEVQHNRSQT